MINPEDPKEWLAQIEKTPESGLPIARLLIARLAQLEEQNEALRNANVELRQKIDTKAHQREVAELQRQIEATVRLVRARSKKYAPTEALIAWTNNGYALAFNLGLNSLDESSLLKYAFRFPAEVKLHLLAMPVADEALFLTNLGQGAVFKVEDLVQVTQDDARWHKIPSLNLSSGEFVSVMLPIGDLPLSRAMITASRGGHVRSLLRWSMDRFLQEGQFGKGAPERDFQACAQLCFGQDANILLFTQKGNCLRFPESSLSSSLAQVVKLDKGEQVVGMVLDDRPESEILIVDSAGKGIRRALKSLQAKSIGARPQPACVTEDVIGVRLVSEHDQVVALMKNGKLVIFDVDQVPLVNRPRPPSPLPGVTTNILAFTSFKSF